MENSPANRSVVFHELGGPEVLRVEHVPPTVPAAGEVRLRVHAIGLNRAEAMFRQGQYPPQSPQFPSKIGYEAVGVIEAVGENVQRLCVGDRIATLPTFAMSRHGVYGDTAVVPASAVVAWPEPLSPEEAAGVWVVWLTVWGGLVKLGALRRGDRVLVTAASSGVGLAAIQAINAEGAFAIATTRKRNKKEALARAGADDVIVLEDEDFLARIAQVTDGKGVNVIFDAVAGPFLGTLAQAAATDARLVIYGFLGGTQAPLPVVPMLRKGLSLTAFSIVRMLATMAAEGRPLDEALAYVRNGLASGAFKPVIDRVFKLNDIVSAHQYLEENEQVGKVVVVP